MDVIYIYKVSIFSYIINGFILTFNFKCKLTNVLTFLSNHLTL